MDPTRRAAYTQQAPPKPSDDFDSYLRALHTRARDLSVTLDKLQGQMLRAWPQHPHIYKPPPDWPTLLSHFGVLTAQLQNIYDELLTSERSWPSRQHAYSSLLQPLHPLYNPGPPLRTRAVPELEALESSAFQSFLAEPELQEYSAEQVRNRINDYNAAAARMARWSQQANALPWPREPGGITPAVAGASTGAITVPAATPGVPAAVAARRSREDSERAEEAELQRTLAGMYTGRNTKLMPAHTHSHVPPTAQVQQQQQQKQPAPTWMQQPQHLAQQQQSSQGR